MARHEQMHGARYGEVLLVSAHLTHFEAAVYNTLGLNDCPDDLWKEIDPEAIKKERRVRAVILNGPRYFLMDAIDIESEVETKPETFGRLQMRRLATLRIPLTAMLDGIKHKPYDENTVVRSTIYTYDAGREVYELVSPGGVAYVMQSYSLEVDSALREADLKTLGSRLHLPEGWRYRARQLDQDFAPRVERQAHVIQDDFQNTYQRT
jgi:hypothetical protein